MGTTEYAPQEYIEYQLMKEVYHCTPSELDEQPEHILNLHREFLYTEAKERKLAEQRSKQQSALKN